MIEDHPFTPKNPGSKSCKWCSFAEMAHKETADIPKWLSDPLFTEEIDQDKQKE